MVSDEGVSASVVIADFVVCAGDLVSGWTANYVDADIVLGKIVCTVDVAEVGAFFSIKDDAGWAVSNISVGPGGVVGAVAVVLGRVVGAISVVAGEVFFSQTQKC